MVRVVVRVKVSGICISGARARFWIKVNGTRTSMTMQIVLFSGYQKMFRVSPLHLSVMIFHMPFVFCRLFS